MEKYIYQMFILGVQNPYEALKKGLGGVIFFANDIKSETQFKSLINEIKAKSLIPPFLSIDQEGGRVERTESIRPRRLSARYALQNGKEFLQKQSEEISKELNNWGINLNFAPCIDVNTNPNNPIIGERAFSDNPDDVILGYEIFSNASKKFGVIPCIKHFPGHGDADKDSHLDLPTITLPFEELKKIHIKPFDYAIKNGADMIMVAHLHCTCFDTDIIPSSLSKNILDYLRHNLKFEGVVITDDMVMKGVQEYGSLDACIMAIKNGVDMFIFRNSDNKTLNMIETLVKIVEQDEELKQKVKQSYNRITNLKQKYSII